MDFPTLTATILGSDTSVTIGVAGLAAGWLVTWAETRFHVGGLRETVKSQEAKIGALETRLAAAEVREGRTMERLDYFASRLDRIDQKLDRILDQGKGVA
jgi:hypothetical protein